MPGLTKFFVKGTLSNLHKTLQRIYTIVGLPSGVLCKLHIVPLIIFCTSIWQDMYLPYPVAARVFTSAGS